MANLHKIVRLLSKGDYIENVSLACSILNKSGVIALPTDTLYGLAAKVSDSVALEKIYKIKGRDAAKPLAICVENVELISQVADVGKTSMNLFKSLLPGPITIIMKRNDRLNKDLNPDSETVGIRVPCHGFVLSLCEQLGPLALTSANKSGKNNSNEINDFSDIWNQLDCIFDSGPIKDNVIPESSIFTTQLSGSTVIDLTNQEKKYKVIREGCALNRTINIMTRFGYVRIK